jgi:hypothetical protein
VEIEGQIAASRWCGPFTAPQPAHRRFSKPEALRQFPKVGEIRDVDGHLWDVRDIRSTKYGFNLCYGTLANDPIPYGGGGLPRLIDTEALRDFWDANRTTHCGLLFDLPAGRTTLKRARKRLGFNFHDDTQEFWRDRMGDLELLPAREFAARHGVQRAVALDRRRGIFGTQTRATGWWRKPKFVKILLSDLTLTRAGRKLGISITHTKRLRDRVQQESQAGQ